MKPPEDNLADNGVPTRTPFLCPDYPRCRCAECKRRIDHEIRACFSETCRPRGSKSFRVFK